MLESLRETIEMKVEPGAKGNCNECGEVRPLLNYPNDSICEECRPKVKKSFVTFDSAWGVVKDEQERTEEYPHTVEEVLSNCTCCMYPSPMIGKEGGCECCPCEMHGKSSND